jgi:hypothetical protein
MLTIAGSRRTICALRSFGLMNRRGALIPPTLLKASV